MPLPIANKLTTVPKCSTHESNNITSCKLSVICIMHWAEREGETNRDREKEKETKWWSNSTMRESSQFFSLERKSFNGSVEMYDVTACHKPFLLRHVRSLLDGAMRNWAIESVKVTAVVIFYALWCVAEDKNHNVNLLFWFRWKCETKTFSLFFWNSYVNESFTCRTFSHSHWPDTDPLTQCNFIFP